MLLVPRTQNDKGTIPHTRPTTHRFPNSHVIELRCKNFFLDICSSKDSLSTQVSGEASDPSTLRYDVQPSQEKYRCWNFSFDFTSTKDSPSLRRNSASFNPAISFSRRTFQPACVSGVPMHCTWSSLKYEGTASCSDCTPSQSVTEQFGACVPDHQTT